MKGGFDLRIGLGDLPAFPTDAGYVVGLLVMAFLVFLAALCAFVILRPGLEEIF